MRYWHQGPDTREHTRRNQSTPSGAVSVDLLTSQKVVQHTGERHQCGDWCAAHRPTEDRLWAVVQMLSLGRVNSAVAEVEHSAARLLFGSAMPSSWPSGGVAESSGTLDQIHQVQNLLTHQVTL